MDVVQSIKIKTAFSMKISVLLLSEKGCVVIFLLINYVVTTCVYSAQWGLCNFRFSALLSLLINKHVVVGIALMYYIIHNTCGYGWIPLHFDLFILLWQMIVLPPGSLMQVVAVSVIDTPYTFSCIGSGENTSFHIISMMIRYGMCLCRSSCGELVHG